MTAIEERCEGRSVRILNARTCAVELGEQYIVSARITRLPDGPDGLVQLHSRLRQILRWKVLRAGHTGEVITVFLNTTLERSGVELS